jgi:hypothetical protein
MSEVQVGRLTANGHGNLRLSLGKVPPGPVKFRVKGLDNGFIAEGNAVAFTIGRKGATAIMVPRDCGLQAGDDVAYILEWMDPESLGAWLKEDTSTPWKGVSA